MSVESCPKCGSTNTFHEAKTGVTECLKCGHKWKRPTIKELMKGEVLDGFVEAQRVRPLTEFSESKAKPIYYGEPSWLYGETKERPKWLPLEILKEFWLMNFATSESIRLQSKHKLESLGVREVKGSVYIPLETGYGQIYSYGDVYFVPAIREKDSDKYIKFYSFEALGLHPTETKSEASTPRKEKEEPEATVREEEIPSFSPAFLSEVERAWKEKRSTSFWDWMMEPTAEGVTVTLRGTTKPHEFFPKDIVERMKYDSLRQVYVVTPIAFKKWRVWFTTPMGFEIFVDVEAMTEEEAKTKAQVQVPTGSEYRYAAVQE